MITSAAFTFGQGQQNHVRYFPLHGLLGKFYWLSTLPFRGAITFHSSGRLPK